MKHLKLWESFNKVNETIFPNEFENYLDYKPSFTYNNIEDFEKALKDYDGSYEPKDIPWGDIIEISSKKYILSEYGEDYMIFQNLTDPSDGYTVYYSPVTSSKGVKTSPFTFRSLEEY